MNRRFVETGAPRVRGDDGGTIRLAGIVAVVLLWAPLSHAALRSMQTPEDKILSKGFAAFMDGKDKIALNYFEEVMRINPQNVAAQRGLEKVKIRLRKAEDVEQAKAHTLSKAKLKEARELMKNGDVVGAVDSLHASLDAVPESRQAKAELSAIKRKMTVAAESRKFSPSTWAFSRGVLAYLDRDWAKAYRIWSERLKMEPENVALAHATVRAENNFKRMMLSEQEDFFRRGARAFYQQGLYQQAKLSWTRVLAIRSDDHEALEGFTRAEEALLRAQGKGRDDKAHDLLEEGLEFYASQEWRRALDTFQRLAQVSPDYEAISTEYSTRIKARLNSVEYTPQAAVGKGWKPERPSNQSGTVVELPEKLENFVDRIKGLEAQLGREPGNINLQQQLDQVKKAQEDESERIYKDGLIAYSQGNRDLAMQQWKQVLVINPEHKKAAAALRKAKAEEDRKE